MINSALSITDHFQITEIEKPMANLSHHIHAYRIEKKFRIKEIVSN